MSEKARPSVELELGERIAIDRRAKAMAGMGEPNGAEEDLAEKQRQAALEQHLANLFERRRSGAITESEYQVALLEVRQRVRHGGVSSSREAMGSPPASGKQESVRPILYGCLTALVVALLLLLVYAAWAYHAAIQLFD